MLRGASAAAAAAARCPSLHAAPARPRPPATRRHIAADARPAGAAAAAEPKGPAQPGEPAEQDRDDGDDEAYGATPWGRAQKGLRGPVRVPPPPPRGADDAGLSFIRGATAAELRDAVPGLRLPSEYEPWVEEAKQWVLRYDADPSRLPTLASCAEPGALGWDAATERWLRERVANPISWWRQHLLLFLYARKKVYFYDAQALLDAPDMWLLSTEQWRQLLQPPPGSACLDVGAGKGDCTACFAPLFDTLVATEVSRPLVWRLRRRGIAAVCTTRVDPRPHDPEYCNVDFTHVFCLNTIDRCSDPRLLLDEIRQCTRPGATAVISCPLPFLHLDFFTRHTLSGLDLAGDMTWEGSAEAVAERLLRPRGFLPRRMVRTPYLSAGPLGQPVSQALDTAVWICDIAF